MKVGNKFWAWVSCHTAILKSWKFQENRRRQVKALVRTLQIKGSSSIFQTLVSISGSTFSCHFLQKDNLLWFWKRSPKHRRKTSFWTWKSEYFLLVHAHQPCLSEFLKSWDSVLGFCAPGKIGEFRFGQCATTLVLVPLKYLSVSALSTERSTSSCHSHLGRLNERSPDWTRGLRRRCRPSGSASAWVADFASFVFSRRHPPSQQHCHALRTPFYGLASPARRVSMKSWISNPDKKNAKGNPKVLKVKKRLWCPFTGRPESDSNMNSRTLETQCGHKMAAQGSLTLAIEGFRWSYPLCDRWDTSDFVFHLLSIGRTEHVSI